MSGDHTDKELLRDISGLLREILEEIQHIRRMLIPRLSATLHIQKGGRKVATLRVGQTAQAVWKEWSGPNGTGNELPPAGPVTFSSSDPSVATVDPTSGLVTSVAAGTATISGTDAANNLSASDTVTDTETAQSATLTVVPN